MKKITGFLIVAVLIFSVFTPFASAVEAPSVHVVIDNELVPFPDAQPFVKEGEAMLPLYFVGQKLGAEVLWNESEYSVTVKTQSDTIVINFPESKHSSSVTLNNETVSGDIAPFIQNDRTYVSLKFLSDLLNCRITWNGGVNTALITSSGYSGGYTSEVTENVTTTEVLTIKSFDGYMLSGKLDLPIGAKEIPTLVIFVPGTGPNTYDNHRQVGDIEFNYYDLFAKELGSRGVAFFRYDTRGVKAGKEPPMFADVNIEEYKAYTPENQAKDIEHMITELKKNEKLKNAKVVLLGWSEGTIIAPLVAERNNVEVSSLMLAGYCNVKMQDIIEWQLLGESSMIFYCQYFDLNLDGVITKQEFEADPYGITKSSLGGVKFEQIDINQDNKLTSEDFALILTERKKQVVDAIANRDAEWIWNNYFHITMEWLDGHAGILANGDRLLGLDIPVNIFHGVYDQNVPLQGVFDIYDACKAKGKTNLKAFVFDQHDHDLNYTLYPFYNKISDGMASIFNECAKVK